MKRCRSALLVLGALVLTAAPAAAGQFQVRILKIGKKTITVVIYQAQSYRRITVADLADARLAGQLVCLEGKLKSSGTSGVRLFGTSHKFKVSAGGLFKKFVSGDNVWLGGRAVRSGPRLTFSITVAVKLKTDLVLFEERFKAAVKAGDWRRLLGLAAWIDKSKGHPKIPFAEYRRYRACKGRAISKACSVAESAFKGTNAKGYAELGVELLKLGADSNLAYRYLRRAADIDPELEIAAKELSKAKAGFVRCRGRWVTAEEKKQLVAAEEEQSAKKEAAIRVREERRAEEAVSGAVACAGDAVEMETALASSRGAEVGTRLASEVERASAPRLARRALFLVASLPAKEQAKPLAVAMRSAEPQIRIAALKLAAARGDLAARKLLASAASGDSSEEVTDLACKLLADAADADAIATLIGLVGSAGKHRSRAAVEQLQKATEQKDRYTPAEWRVWWKKNKGSFPPGPKK